MKTVTIEQASLNEIEKIKSAITALGMNPDEFSIAPEVIHHSYPLWYQQTPQPLTPNYPFGQFETTCVGISN